VTPVGVLNRTSDPPFQQTGVLEDLAELTE
jgi:hypothetical protein